MGLRAAAVILAVAGVVGSARAAGPSGKDRFWSDAKENVLTRHHSMMGQVARQAMPAVVSITTVEAPVPGTQPEPHAEAQKGVGAGFIVSADGYVLTCAHVIEDATDIRVSVLSREGYPEDFPARVVGQDAATDFALLKIDAGRPLPILKLGTSRSVDIADWLVVIGSPFGLAHSVSVGVVSYKGRTEVTPAGRNGYFDYIQTDASINPGNSGGPILDIEGDVVAVANAVNVAGQGIGFAVPVDVAKAVLADLRNLGSVRRGWLGLSLQDLSPELAEAHGRSSYHGVLVSEVIPGSPADRAGLRAGDVIANFEHAKLHRAFEMRWRVATADVGQHFTLDVERDAQMFPVGVVLGAPPPKPQPKRVAVSEQPAMGVVVKDVDSQAGAHAGLAQPLGALIGTLEPQSPLSRAGLAPGDVVLRVNNTEVASESAFWESLSELDKGDVVRLFVRRGAKTVALAFHKP